jgi:hypothetical protein
MKPILIVRIPVSDSEIYEKVSDQLKDVSDLTDNYIMLIVSTHDIINFEFQALYPKDFDIADLERLKQEIKGKIEHIICT